MSIDSSLIAALVGALVGGGASLAGSIYVGRIDLTRKTRIGMYRDIIPPLQEKVSRIIDDSARRPRDEIPQISPPHDDLYKAIEILHREAIVAGRNDSTMVKRIEELCRRQQGLTSTSIEVKKHDPDFQLKIALIRLKEEAAESDMTDDERTRWLAKAEKDVTQELNPAGWNAELKQLAENYFALDRSISEKLGNMRRFLERKIR